MKNWFNGDYRRKCVILEIYDALQTDTRNGHTYKTPLNATHPPAHRSIRSSNGTQTTIAQPSGPRTSTNPKPTNPWSAIP